MSIYPSAWFHERYRRQSSIRDIFFTWYVANRWSNDLFSPTITYLMGVRVLSFP